MSKKPFLWNKDLLKFIQPGGADVPPSVAKSAIEAVIGRSQFAISDASQKLAIGEITDSEWLVIMLRETKIGNMAAAALAHGGTAQMTVDHWQSVSDKIIDQWTGVEGKYPGLHGFFVDVVGGRYGPSGALNGMVGQRAGMYANAFRATYENTRTEAHKEENYTTAKRIASTAVENCPTCADEDGVERPIDEVVPIGESECGGGRCHCVIIYSKG